MNEKARIHRIFDDLNLAPGRFFLSGSGVMILHGMDRKPRDLDIFMSTATWFSLYNQQSKFANVSGSPREWSLFATDPDDPKRRCDPPYLYKTMHGLEVNIFFQWRTRGIGDIDVNFWMHNAEIVDGIPCVPLMLLLDWKQHVGRNKDVQDIRMIRDYLGVGNAE